MEVAIIIIIWTLAIYGLFEIIRNIININMCTKLNSKGVYLIVAVKNQENYIEGFLRYLMFKLIYGKEDMIKNIIIVDLNSTDKTKEIIEKLQSDYTQIKILNYKECKDLIENIKEA